MKKAYIPKGVTAAYDSLETEQLVVNSCLKVAHELKAKTIRGSGVILAETISADDIHVRKIEAASVYCLRLSAKWVRAKEVLASEDASVSCYLCANYVASTRLTVALHKMGQIDAVKVVNLPPKKIHPFWMLLAVVLRPFQVFGAMFRAVLCAGEIMDAEYQKVPDDKVRPAA